MQRGRGGRDKGSGNSVQREFDNDSVTASTAALTALLRAVDFPPPRDML